MSALSKNEWARVGELLNQSQRSVIDSLKNYMPAPDEPGENSRKRRILSGAQTAEKLDHNRPVVKQEIRFVQDAHRKSLDGQRVQEPNLEGGAV